MTSEEVRFMERVPALLAEIARQLKVANELKALEMKQSKFILNLSDEQIDAVSKGERDD